MLDRRDPEYLKQREAAKLLQDHNWMDGYIGDATYLRSLMILGWGDRDAQVELSLLKMEKARMRGVCTREQKAARHRTQDSEVGE